MPSGEPDAQRPRGAGRRPAPRPGGRCRPGGDGAALRRPTRRQRPQRRRGGRPAGCARCGCWPGWAPARSPRTCAGTPSSPASTPAGSSPAERAGEPRRRRPRPRRLRRLRLPRPRRRRLAVDRRGARRASCPTGRRSCTSGRSPAGPRRAPTRSPGWSSGLHADGSALISVDPNIRPMLAEGPVGAALGNTAAARARAAGPAGRPGRRGEGQRRGPRLAGPDLRRPATTTGRATWADRGPALVLAHRRRRAAAHRPPRAAPCCTGRSRR